jgi:polyisoprenoid-binding protein YceI
MRNTYIIVAMIVLVALVGFLMASKKTEAPVEKEMTKNSESNEQINSIFADGVYKLETDSSSIFWEGEYLTGLKENGTVKLQSGEVTVVNGAITGGEFVIDMKSIESVPHKDLLVSHLKAPDFFEVEKYDTAKFVLKSVAPTSSEGVKEGRFVLAGDLTVKGILKPISLVATITNDQNSLKASASFAINRADWEIKYNSPTFFSNLGDKIIRDAVTIGLDLKAQRVIQ